MPPKKAAAGQKVSSKTVEKQKNKVIEDKTFGLKNKNKSAKVQKYIDNVKVQVTKAAAIKQGKKPDEKPKKTKAELEKEKQEELNEFFKITQAKIAPGADPKSVLCEFFKMGLCTKGDRCKYSHDMNVARKAEKIDVYSDRRDFNAEGQLKTPETMTPEELDRYNRVKAARSDTEIVCKYFLDAVEQKLYGWFWVCPNAGDACPYRHALPQGFVLKVKKTEEEILEDKRREEEERTPIEDQIEEQRKAIITRTPVTLELFLEWRKKSQAKKIAETEEAERKKKEKKEGRTQGMSGREMFIFNPALFVDDEEAFGAEDYEADDDDLPDGPERVITVTGTSISIEMRGDEEGEEKEKEEGGPIDESLFTGEVDESLFTEEPEEEKEEKEKEDEDEEEEGEKKAESA